ncbi:MAG: hypothetical protein AABY84_00575 [Candidatus Firestonebacteria bacterium]
MEDVIFNGTDSRKQLSMAEVSLTFSNPKTSMVVDYEEVTVTRRIFRSGESEYLMNKTSCRLKDIQELFMDTGIGTDAYFLLEQGKMDLILSTKPADRRYLFEEAAGIAKYKNRKEESLRKLEATEANLLRINDIISEIKRQTNSLERQAKRAEKYKELNNELKDLEIIVNNVEYKKLQVQLLSDKKDALDLKCEIEGLNTKISTNDSEIQSVKLRFLEKEKAIVELQNTIHKVELELAKAENNILLVQDHIKSLNEQKNTDDAEIDVLQKKYLQQEENLKKLMSDLQHCVEKSNQSKEDVVKGRNDLKDFELSKNESLKRVKECENKISEIRAVLNSKEGRLYTLKELQNKWEGYGKGVKAVMDTSNLILPELKTVVANIILTDGKYEKAIAAVLGDSLQNIIVKDLQSALSIIKYLKEEDKGRVTLMPLDTLKDQNDSITSDVLSFSGVVGKAMDFVKKDTPYFIALKNLLSNVVIVEDINIALELSKNAKGITIVTLNGELVISDKDISGGSDDIEGEILLIREREIENLKLELDTLNSELRTAENELEKWTNEFNAIEDKLNNQYIKLQEEELELTGLGKDISSLEREIQTVSLQKVEMEETVEKKTNGMSLYNDKITNLQTEITSSESKINVLIAEKENFETKLLEEKQIAEKLKYEIEEFERAIKDIRDEITSRQDFLHKLDVTIAQLEMQISNLKEQMEKDYHIDLDAIEKLPEAEINLEEKKQKIQEFRAKIEEIGPVNLVAMEEYQELETRYKFLSEQEADLRKAKEDLHNVINEINATTKSLFLDTFTKVKTNFSQVFKNLFVGGEADLILVDEGNLLESGIEIVARPPGKRLQSISLLSGGERALTAIALLFAIFMVKPSPFCVLDEIDAPLDDVNVNRFATILKEFSKNTQFIIITHSKLTMETADVLYGVTMEEAGVSKIMSMKFADKESTIKKQEIQQPEAIADVKEPVTV